MDEQKIVGMTILVKLFIRSVIGKGITVIKKCHMTLNVILSVQSYKPTSVANYNFVIAR